MGKISLGELARGIPLAIGGSMVVPVLMGIVGAICLELEIRPERLRNRTGLDASALLPYAEQYGTWLAEACPTATFLQEENQLARDSVVDAWGTPFEIECVYDDPDRPVFVVSLGPDHTAGTSDDIRVPQLRWTSATSGPNAFR